MAEFGKVIKQGYLTKQGGIVKNWRRRWFVLRGNVLSYYKLRTDPEPAGTILLGGMNKMYSILPASKKMQRKNAFELQTEDRLYNLLADDAESMNEWITCIKQILNHQAPSNGTQKKGDSTVIRVKGMMCERCVLQVRKLVYNVTKIDDVSVNADEELITIKGTFNVSELQEELEEAGFIPSVQAQ